MDTYYQKHRTIQAVQFNGMLSQLRQIFDRSIFNHVYDGTRINYGIKPIYNHQRYIKILLNNDSLIKWNQVSRKTHYHKSPAQSPRLNLWHIKPGQVSIHPGHYHIKYMITPQNIYLGDYITIKNHIETQIQYDRHHHKLKTVYVLVPVIKIYQKTDFEAHWSKNPIKHRRH